MLANITREVLESHLKCRYKAHLKLAGEHGSPSDYELLHMEATEQVRQAATESLLAQYGEGELLRNCTATVEVLRRGAPLLLDATIESQGLSVRFDALQRAAGKSALGRFHYLPVLFDEAEKATHEQRSLIQLCGLVVGSIQGKEPERGVLIHGRSCEVRSLKLGSGIEKARRTLEELRQRPGKPPTLLLNDHCPVCEFRDRCHAAALAGDNLSLLRGMSEKEVKKFFRRGIFTVTQLSCTFHPPRRQKAKHPNQNKQLHQHALQALAVREKKVHILGTPELPASPARIYFDIEGDPERGFDYLVGVLIETNGTEERHSFWADDPADEPRIFQQFLELLAAHPDACLYAYGNYEASFLRRVGKNLAQEKIVASILARTFNVLSVIHPHVYFPTYSNGLKDIAGYLGFRWTTPDATGIQSTVWRRRWEVTRSAVAKETLTTYNLDDCAALKRVTEFLYAACRREPQTQAVPEARQEIARVDEMNTQGTRPNWGDTLFSLPDFTFINERAHFAYQRDKVFVRTGNTLPKRARPKRNRWRRNRRVNREIQIISHSCPACGGTKLEHRQSRCLARFAFDLRITRSGIRKWVSRYRTSWHYCRGCGNRFLPGEYLRLEEFCHSLKSWAMYEHVAHRTSLPNIADTITECFNLPFGHARVHEFKQLLADYYSETYKELLTKIVGGELVHIDETEVHLRGVGKGYVWVFTNLEEVVYLYRASREGEFLHEMLKGFRGVLVSDFYGAYDSLECVQQKCLVHLIRDLNNDIVANPWDEELKSLGSAFGTLLRAMVATVDRWGLRRRHLKKHRRDVERFFRVCVAEAFRSEVAEGYRKRMLKYRDKLFTFLDHDDVPWNNNNAEHAVKAFANYRELADHLLTESGLNHYLVLLSVYQTCKYKGLSFLRFLLSGQTDIDVFHEDSAKRVVPTIELSPEGAIPHRRSRKPLKKVPPPL